MLLLSLNKTGLQATLVLILHGLLLNPACGRPAFDDEDPVADEDQEGDEDHMDEQTGLEDEDENAENDESTVPTLSREKCEELRRRQQWAATMVKMCLELGVALEMSGASGSGSGAGASGSGTSGSGSGAGGSTMTPGSKDDYDDY